MILKVRGVTGKVLGLEAVHNSYSGFDLSVEHIDVVAYKVSLITDNLGRVTFERVAVDEIEVVG
jgi:hypothetical protein